MYLILLGNVKRFLRLTVSKIDRYCTSSILSEITISCQRTSAGIHSYLYVSTIYVSLREVSFINVSFAGQVQLESLPNAAVVHLWPFFKLLSSFLESCISQEDPLSDDQHWTVKSVV